MPARIFGGAVRSAFGRRACLAAPAATLARRHAQENAVGAGRRLVCERSHASDIHLVDARADEVFSPRLSKLSERTASSIPSSTFALVRAM